MQRLISKKEWQTSMNWTFMMEHSTLTWALRRLTPRCSSWGTRWSRRRTRCGTFPALPILEDQVPLEVVDHPWVSWRKGKWRGRKSLVEQAPYQLLKQGNFSTLMGRPVVVGKIYFLSFLLVKYLIVTLEVGQAAVMGHKWAWLWR